MTGSLYEIRQYLNQQGIFFAMSGPISQDIMAEIADTLKRKMRLEETNTSVVFSVFSMLIEQAQNIIHYSAEKLPVDDSEENKGEISLGTIAVGCEDAGYFVLTGNLIKHAKVERLRGKLNKLRGMDKEELKRYYKEQRRKEREEGSKGAGLGFIEMARKASKPIEFDFVEVDEAHSFFSVKVVI